MKELLNSLSKEQLLALVLQQTLDLENHKQELQQSNTELQKSNIELQQSSIKLQNSTLKLQKKQEEATFLKLLVQKLQRMLFGSKKERFTTPPIEGQLSLSFEELEAKNPDTSPLPVKEILTYTRQKNENHKGRNKLPDNLPVTQIVVEPSESTEGLVKIGEEITEILEYAPGKFFKLLIVRPKYAKAGNQGVIIGELPSRPIEKCLAGNVLLSSILINKYVDHLPLYRQQQIFKRSGIEIAPSTIDGWVSQLGDLLLPLYNAMINTIKQDRYLQVDETPTRVLDKDKKGECHRGYYWVYHSPLKAMAVFDYQQGRDKDAPRKILENFNGYLQTDGYAVYKQYYNKKEVVHLACWAHARRYFEQAIPQDKARAEHALTEIQKIYQIEREIKDLDAETTKEVRLEKALPIINELGKWIASENKKVLPKSLIGKAFQYSIHLWDSLQNYLYNGELKIDNNLVENCIRPNALGRKNYLFAGSHEGAKRSAMFYTFMATCKLNTVEPLAWLTEVLNKIADHKANKLFELFPQNLKLPQK
jgi:transposase